MKPPHYRQRRTDVHTLAVAGPLPLLGAMDPTEIVDARDSFEASMSFREASARLLEF